ncbi:MAG: hypothetical protein A2901_06045 [Elusimicrobia bacterium RIFCSPLOWO2_01_FULL_54_10]|nr:MAG: hypothetical protein A2901_06045 [Elusimicrobia bacterium RIFCSPLOWO2_01_FULL_54_10]
MLASAVNYSHAAANKFNCQELIYRKPEQHAIQKPMDLLDRIPIVRDINRMIPRKFSLARHKFRFINLNRIIIEKSYESLHSRQALKNSIISMTYAGAAGGAAYINLEVPLFYSESLGGSKWSAYPAGNYTVDVDRGSGSAEERFFLTARARF